MEKDRAIRRRGGRKGGVGPVGQSPASSHAAGIKAVFCTRAIRSLIIHKPRIINFKQLTFTTVGVRAVEEISIRRLHVITDPRSVFVDNLLDKFVIWHGIPEQIQKVTGDAVVEARPSGCVIIDPGFRTVAIERITGRFPAESVQRIGIRPGPRATTFAHAAVVEDFGAAGETRLSENHGGIKFEVRHPGKIPVVFR